MIEIQKAEVCLAFFNFRIPSNRSTFTDAVAWLRREYGAIGHLWDYNDNYFYFKDSKDAAFFALKWS